MPDAVIEAIVVAVLVLINSLLAMSEMAIVSARKTKLLQWADGGDTRAKLALDIANNPTRMLSCIQIGITLASLITGIFGGATIADDISDYLAIDLRFKPYADAIAITLVTGMLTYFSIVLGELVPKRIALNFPELIAKYSAQPLILFSTLVRPLVWILSASTDTVVRVLGLKLTHESPVTEAEIHVMVEQATEAGIFEEAEQEMVASVLMLDNRKAGALMTPRTEIEWLDIKDNDEEWIKYAVAVPHSRLIVAEGSLDHIVGIVDAKALVNQKLQGKVDLKPLLQQPLYVPENISALDLIQRFRESAQQIAIVLDEYGGVHGLVSREDIFQAIVGDLPTIDEAMESAKIAQQADGTWLCDGSLETDEFKEALQLQELPGEGEDADYRTVAGLVLYQLEHVPSEGEQFVWKDLEFTVVDMDRHRIDKLRIRRLPAPPQKTTEQPPKPQSGS